MSNLVGFVAEDRVCLSVEGADARAVLQGVVTNDVDRLSQPGILYTALLTPQGKYLFDFFLVSRGEHDVLIDVAAERADALAKRLTMYCLRRDAKVSPVPDVKVGVAWSVAGESEAAPDMPQSKASLLVSDPRDAALGVRIYGRDPGAALAAMSAGGADPADFAALRVRRGIPETGIELVADESYPLEAGFERLAGVDFRKGCYVGQEVTARMKHKTTLRKGLVRVAVDGSAPAGTEVRGEDGRAVGTLFTQANGEGLAHLRFDRAKGVLRAGDAEVRMLDA